MDITVDEYDDGTYDFTLDIDDDDNEVRISYNITHEQVEKMIDVLTHNINSSKIDNIIKC